MRRGNGDGSIFKLSGKRRKPWAFRITMGGVVGGGKILHIDIIGFYPCLYIISVFQIAL